MTVKVSPAVWKKAIQDCTDKKLTYAEIDHFTFVKINNEFYAYDNNPANDLGQGQFSEVKRAVDQAGHEWAIKIQQVKKEKVKEHKLELNKENQVLKQLGRLEFQPLERSIIQTAASNTSKAVYGNIYYGIMPIVEGIDLAFHLTQHKIKNPSLPPDIALKIAIKCCKAIEDLHTHQVAHQDVHTGNFMLKGTLEQPEISVHDFGKAIILDQSKMGKDKSEAALSRDVQQLRALFITELGLEFLKKHKHDPLKLTLNELITICQTELKNQQPTVQAGSSSQQPTVQANITSQQPTVKAGSTSQKLTIQADAAKGPPPATNRQAMRTTPVNPVQPTTTANVQQQMKNIVKNQNR